MGGEKTFLKKKSLTSLKTNMKAFFGEALDGSYMYFCNAILVKTYACIIRFSKCFYLSYIISCSNCQNLFIQIKYNNYFFYYTAAVNCYIVKLIWVIVRLDVWSGLYVVFVYISGILYLIDNIAGRGGTSVEGIAH